MAVMNEQYRLNRGAVALMMVLVAIVVGVVTYNLGVTHGLAQSAQGGQAELAAPGAYHPYGWYHPWGFGFLFPFLYFGLWFLAIRVLFWGGPWRRYRYYAGHDAGRREMPRMFDEWHRRAHERMRTEPPPANG